MKRTHLLPVAIASFTLLALNLAAIADEPPHTPPPPSAPRKAAFPNPHEKTLANGLHVIIVERPALPLISVKLLVRNGAEIDPPGKAGLANLTASLLTKGTETRSAPQIAEAMEQLGASLESGAEWDDSYLRLTVLSSQEEAALAILSDLLRHPTFKDEELARLRIQFQNDIQVELGDVANLARFSTAKVNFGNSAYGHPVVGLPASLDRITREDVLNLYTARYQPQNIVLVISGDITAEKGFEMINRIFGDWNGSKELGEISGGHPASYDYKPRTVVIDMPTAGQSAIMLGKPGIARNSKEYFQGIVANAVLGVGYSSRLNEEIRIKRGLSYGAASDLDARRETGPFVTFAQTMNEASGTVVGLMKQQIAGLSRDLVGDPELNTRKATLSGEFARLLETNEGFAAEAGKLALNNIPLDAVNSYIGSIQAVTSKQVQTFATLHMQPDQMSVIVVGNTALFQKALQDQLKGAELIESTALDFETPSLQQPAPKK
ncbi:MAG: pitrilysin family protein [Chthoniobacteraceae bacterium]